MAQGAEAGVGGKKKIQEKEKMTRSTTEKTFQTSLYKSPVRTRSVEVC